MISTLIRGAYFLIIDCSSKRQSQALSPETFIAACEAWAQCSGGGAINSRISMDPC